MSFSETEKDDDMTVEEAIAFIDSFDGILGDDSGSGNGTSSPSSSASSESGIVYSVAKTGPKRKKKGNPPGYTTRMQQKKKAELLELREEVRELEQVLGQVKRSKTSWKTSKRQVEPDAAEVRSKWEQLAAAEYDERRRSELKNRRLKAILAHQAEVDQNLQRVLQRRSLLQGIDFVFGNEPTSTYSFAAFENSKSIVNHLQQKVAQLYLDSGSVFQGGPPSTVCCSMQMKHDAVFGMTAEALATTPMLCPMEVAADICWKDLSIHRPCPEKWARCMRGSEPDSQEKNWILKLQTDLMMLNNEELQFRDQTWTIIYRSETNSNASVVRVCEQMYLDRQVGISTARPEDVEYAQSVVLKNLSWKLREHTQHLQDMLVEETQRYGVVAAVAAY
ncbi:hypothetical protein PR001_g30108 [Phytophthora rubi]|uniref:BZIP domain-containing protein n=2 Tax=Phytophthora rubi TaxID=129364 RepID=A0A6A3GWF6_9STRA|nr:hypothetical protein PR001_g30108 [Phytophthora rubi]